MSRRTERAAEDAARQASDAARVLQERGQQARAERAVEPVLEPAAVEPPATPDQGRQVRIEPEKNPRNRILEEIVESRAPKLAAVEPPAAEPPPAPPAAEATPAALPARETAPAEPASPAAPAPEAPKTVRVKVDGEEFDASAVEVEEAGGVRQFQIQRASERRLKVATDTLAEAKRLIASIPATPQTPAKPSETDAQFIASKVDIMRFGTADESAAAQLEILQRLAPKPVDADAIAARVQATMDHNIAVRQFDRDNADLVTNPVILQAVAAHRHIKLQQHAKLNPGAPVDWPKFYGILATEVRSAFGRPSQPATTTPATPGTTSQPSDKEARKASIVNLPTAAAARAATPAEEKPQTREEVLNEMRKKRGLPVG